MLNQTDAVAYNALFTHLTEEGMAQMLLGLLLWMEEQIINWMNDKNLQLRSFLAVQEMTLML
jgi:hypothetical protein